MKWGEDGKPSDPLPSGRGFGEIVKLGSASPRSKDEGEDRWCSTRRIVESSCRTEEVEPGRFVRKCEKTEKILKDCIGRPTEVVVCKSEHSEDDVTDEVTSGLLPFKSSEVEPFTFPGLRGGIEAIERGLESDLEGMERSLSKFLDAADEMASRLFQSFSIPSQHSRRESSPFVQGRPGDRQLEEDISKQMNNESAYSDYTADICDV